MATLEQVAQALLDAQQTMLAMRQQFDAELRGMRDQVEAASRTAVPRPEVRSIDARVLGKPEPFLARLVGEIGALFFGLTVARATKTSSE